jgi:uncharacterized protein YciU (UPF0263 family)
MSDLEKDNTVDIRKKINQARKIFLELNQESLLAIDVAIAIMRF